MNEEELEASISTYKVQLQSVEDALLAAGDSDELTSLRDDLKNLLTMSEESLIALKKERLMAMVNAASEPAPQDNAMDDEFAAFQAALGGDVTTSHTPTPPPETSAPITCDPDDSDSSDDPDDLAPDLAPDLPDLEGVQCRIPYAPNWGHVEFHNALILCAEPIVAESEPKVRVLFCQPTKTAMVTCPYYIQGKCKFSEEECRYSHGYVVDVSKLEEYQETDFSLLKLESCCLAKYSDDVWYPAVVVEEPTDPADVQYQVLFEDYEETVTVAADEIIPHESPDSSDSEGEEEEEGGDQSADPRQSSDEDEALPVYLYKPQTTEKMGDWEKHTKGIGSKLMKQMGFVVGGGLGKTGQGRADPVPIQLLPQGKSLDKIMELKALAGDQDLYDVLKKQKQKQKQQDAKAASQYQKEGEKVSVFDIINKKLGHKKGDVKSLVAHKKAVPNKHIGVRELHSKSNKDINVQLFQTSEEISKVEKEVNRLRQSVQRTEESDPKVAKNYKKQLEEMEKYLGQLKNSEQSIQRHKNTRRDHKKMAVF